MMTLHRAAMYLRRSKMTNGAKPTLRLSLQQEDCELWIVARPNSGSRPSGFFRYLPEHIRPVLGGIPGVNRLARAEFET
jgi:hypothetical protein